ncbi:SPW repeat protein [Methylobacterium sp. WCS2018Hpa-22]|uniref:SPW repeat protein n=1 Tax=Methylobacterium sp. WCS2018Hpa-22 TaxID=3073633 RepID=UPI002889E731|nr:SPW repeat protein [Methylobacterium sp. WCS2018Hpa-22]
MRTIENRAEDAVLNGLNVFLGIALFLAPWYLELSSETSAARNAFICGAAIAVIAMLALSKSYDWEEYLNLAVGLWVAAAPWALGFAEMKYVMGAHVVIGMSVVALSGFELWRLYRSPEARSV